MKYYVTFKQIDENNKVTGLWDEDLKHSYAILYCKKNESPGKIAWEIPFLYNWKTIHMDGYVSFRLENYPDGCIGIFGKKTPEDEADEIIENIYNQRRANIALRED